MSDLYTPGEGKEPGTPNPAKGVHWYAPGPVSRAFMLDESFICGIMGPFGSGKSTTVIMKLIKSARLQQAGPDGWKRRRTAIIRNTYPELRTTTMNSVFAWIPKGRGKWRESGPPMLHIIDPKAKLDWEIYFIALDRPEDVAKLLGMELSDAWVNEAREVAKAIIDALTGRVGRFPAMWQGGCYLPQIHMDTNPCDTDHWWYTLAEKDGSDEKRRQLLESIAEAEHLLKSKGLLKEGQSMFSFHRQPSGRSANPENLRNLRAGYYEFLMAGKDQDFIKVYVDGDYGFVMDGKPVYPEYRDHFHAASEFPVIPGLGFRIGCDWGLTPAATIAQRLPNGRWQVHNELVATRLGIVAFANELARKLSEKYPGVKIVSCHGDPSGTAGEDENEETPFKIMRANGFKMIQPASTNDPTRRREAMRFLLKGVIDGEPAIKWHKANCPVSRKAMAGGFHYRRLKIVGEDRYHDSPDKNEFSHVVEGGEYALLGGGEDRNVMLSPEFVAAQGARAPVAKSDYDMFNTGA